MKHTTAIEEMANEKEAQLYTCRSCEKKYIVRKCEAQNYAKGSDRHYCVSCQIGKRTGGAGRPYMAEEESGGSEAF